MYTKKHGPRMFFAKAFLGVSKPKISILGDETAFSDAMDFNDRCYPMEQAAEAHLYVEDGQKKANVVITMEPKMQTTQRVADQR